MHHDASLEDHGHVRLPGQRAIFSPKSVDREIRQYRPTRIQRLPRTGCWETASLARHTAAMRKQQAKARQIANKILEMRKKPTLPELPGPARRRRRPRSEAYGVLSRVADNVMQGADVVL